MSIYVQICSMLYEVYARMQQLYECAYEMCLGEYVDVYMHLFTECVSAYALNIYACCVHAYTVCARQTGERRNREGGEGDGGEL